MCLTITAVICKLNLFMKSWSTITSGTLLVCIAIDRYRRVCRPFGVQVSFQAARNMCIGSAVVGVVFSWSLPVMYNIQTVELKAYNLTISECEITASMRKTLYPVINNVSQASLFAVALAGLVVMYSFIAVHVKRKVNKINSYGGRRNTTQSGTENKFHGTFDRNKCEHDDCGDETTVDHIESDSVASKHSTERKNDTPETEEIEMDKLYNRKRALSSVRRTKRKNHRLTWILFMVSVAFVVSYLPLLSVRIISFVDKSFAASLTDSERAVYKFVYRSYFINCAVNPVIYGVWDSRFREFCKKLFACKHV